MPCHPARARQLLKAKKAAVYKRYPFTIILLERDSGDTQPTELKIDPGSKTTGLAVVVEGKCGRRVVWAAELGHRGQAVKEALDSRRAVRRSRRACHTRYRQPRFNNRTKAKGWLPPSLHSRVDNIITWGQKLYRYCPLQTLAFELVKFDIQLMENAEIRAVEYQQGTLVGYEIREYLLEKWDRRCVYCGKQNVPFEIEHIIPKERGGGNRLFNLTLACHNCNQAKGIQTAAEFGHPEIQGQAHRTLRDAAAVNTTRYELHRQLLASRLPLTTGSGGQTKFNRITQHYPKSHWIDAACVSETGENVYLNPEQQPLLIKATGRGSRQMCRVDRFGFPRTSAKSAKRVHGFQTGDMVKAVVTQGKKTGVYTGRVAIRSSGKFNINTGNSTIQGISHKLCNLIQYTDGYSYTYPKKGEKAFPPHG